MYMDVSHLRDFYDGPLGQVARRVLWVNIRARWASLKGVRVLGVGFTAPYLGVFRDEAERVLCAMPARQGVSAWPEDESNAAFLTDCGMWPLPDGAVDRILLVHGLETAENAADLLREAWRCLAPGGRLMAVAPNRRGLWARAEGTPFGHGRPFSRNQLGELLRENAFTPEFWGEALFFLPLERGLLLRSAVGLERIGTRFCPSFGGVHIVEAVKEAYRAIPVFARKVMRKTAEPLLGPGQRPVPAPRL